MVEENKQLSRQAEEQALNGLPLAHAIDFTNDLCSPTECAAYRNGQWLYRDGAHLSVGGALRLLPRFKEAIALYAQPKH